VKACGLTRPAYNAFREVSPSSDNMKTRLPVGCEVSGIIQSCGTEVTTLRPGDTVVGIIPMDYGQSGCSEYVVLNEYDVGMFHITTTWSNSSI
jgi:NADPH:quinone reductase-like Zn-dependent oxidoreductase